MAIFDGPSDRELADRRAQAEACRPAFTPFVGAKRLLLPGVDELPAGSWEPMLPIAIEMIALFEVRNTQRRTPLSASLRSLSDQCRQTPGLNSDSTSLAGFLYFFGNPTEFNWGLVEKSTRRIFFPLAKLTHPSGDIVSPYLILQEGRRLSWNVLAIDGARLENGDAVLYDADHETSNR